MTRRSPGRGATDVNRRGRMHEDPVAQTLDRSDTSNTSDWTIRPRFLAQSSSTRSTTSPAVFTAADSLPSSLSLRRRRRPKFDLEKFNSAEVNLVPICHYVSRFTEATKLFQRLKQKKNNYRCIIKNIDLTHISTSIFYPE